MNWVPDKTQDWNTKCINLFIPVFPFRPHLSQTKQVCSLKPNVYGTLIQVIKLPIILAWTNTVENRIAQHLRSVHLLRHLPMALFGGFGASSLQSSTAQYCSWGGRCLHNTSTCCKAACNPRCTYVALCIFFVCLLASVYRFDLQLFVSYKQTKKTPPQFCTEKEVIRETAKWTTQHELNVNSSKEAMDENKPGTINRATDESANSDSGEISIRPTDTLLSQDTHPPFHSRHPKLGVGPLIKNKLAHQ